MSNLDNHFFRILSLLAVGFGLMVIFMGISSLLVSKMIVNLMEGEIEKSVEIAKNIGPPLNFGTTISLDQIAILNASYLSTQSIIQINDLIGSISDLSQASARGESELSISEFSGKLRVLSENLVALNNELNNSSLISIFLSSDDLDQFSRLSSQLSTFSAIFSDLENDSQTWLIIFQNSDELRPTGGFMGSYSLLKINQGKFEEMIFEDIYDADGQFTGFIEPPAGISTYLAGNKGLRLPDANWEPDFPTSAQQILQFFALGDRSNINGIIALNLKVIEDLLSITGPLEIPDYNLPINSQNVHHVLRIERDEFFPGSLQKKHLISQLFNQLKIALAQLDPIEIRNFTYQLSNHVPSKNIQAFSLNPEIQEYLHKIDLAGSIYDCQADFLIINAEANVGINKANRLVTRSYELKFNENTIELMISFQNQNLPLNNSPLSQYLEYGQVGASQAPHLGYINYHRTWVPSSWQLDKIKEIDDSGENNVVANITQVSRYGGLSEIAFLTITPEKSSRSYRLLFNTDEEIDSEATFCYIKQSGTGPTPFKLSFMNNDQELVINENFRFSKP